MSSETRARALAVAVCVGILATLACLFRPYFPNAAGEVASDYGYYLPHMYDGAAWFHANGPFAVPWFTPSFCGGLPAFPNPQNDYYSVPQLLDLAVGPLGAIRGTLILFAGLGFAGSYLLMRDVFRAGPAASLFASSVFALNGFYLWRMIAGHLQFHPFMLVPLVAWATLSPAPGANPRASLARRTCLAGAAIGYAIEAGALQHVPLMLLSIVAVGLVHGAATGATGRAAWLFCARLAAALVVGVALAAGKLVAILSFLRHSPRELYPIPGVRTVGDLVELVVVPLLWRPRMDHLAGAIVNTKWYWNPSEFELGVGPVPLALLVAGAFLVPPLLTLRVLRRREEGSPIARGLGWGTLLAIVVAVSLSLNVYPAFVLLENAAPFLRNAHAFFRYDAVLIPVAVFGSAVVLDRFVQRHVQWLFPLAAVALLVAADQKTLPGYGGGYAAASVQRAHERLAHVDAIPPIRAIATVDESAAQSVEPIAAGESVYPCYEPMFGYLLETFPRNALHVGPVTDETDGAYNLLDPACFVFPRENGCAAGDRLKVENGVRFERFRAHQGLSFERPWWQWAADLTSLIALLAVSMVLLARAKLVP